MVKNNRTNQIAQRVQQIAEKSRKTKIKAKKEAIKCRNLPVIASVKTYVLRCPIGKARFYSSQSAFPERNSFLVCIETDTGIQGWGEGGQYGPAEPVACVIDDVIGPFILKREVQPTVLWEELYAATRDFGQRGTYIDAISAVNTAMWDIMGKHLGVPLCDLIGGAHRKTVATYGTGCYYRGGDVLDVEASIKTAVEEAKRILSQGFKVLKTKIGLLSIEDDARRIKAIRDAVGPDVQIGVDANHAYSVPIAARMARLLEPLNVAFFEEPVVPEDLDGHARLRQQINIPIASGECWFTRFQFLEAFQKGAVDIAQPDINATGGISEFLKIAALASAFHVPVIPHAWGSGIALATTLHCVAALPNAPHTANPIPLQNEPLVELDRNFNDLRDRLLLTSVYKFKLDKNGRLAVPTGPGLGVEIDLKVLKEFTTREGQTPRPKQKQILANIFVTQGKR